VSVGAGEPKEEIVIVYERCETSARPVRVESADSVQFYMKGVFKSAWDHRQQRDNAAEVRRIRRSLYAEQLVGRLGPLLKAPTAPVSFGILPEELCEGAADHLEPGTVHLSRIIPEASDSYRCDNHQSPTNRRRMAAFAVLKGWIIGGDMQLLYASPTKQSNALVYSADHGQWLPGGFDWTAETLADREDDVLVDGDPSIITDLQLRRDELIPAARDLALLNGEEVHRIVELCGSESAWQITQGGAEGRLEISCSTSRKPPDKLPPLNPVQVELVPVKSWFSVIRYVPRPSTEEFVNVGVVVGEGTRVDVVRFVQSFRRASMLGGTDAESDVRSLQAELVPGDGISKVEDISRRWHGRVRVTPPRPAALSSQELAVRITRTYLGEELRAHTHFETVPRTRVRDRLVERLREARTPNIVTDARIEGAVGSRTFDLGQVFEPNAAAIDEGGTSRCYQRIMHAFSFQTLDTEPIMHACEVFCFGYEDIRKSLGDGAPAAAVVVREPLGGGREDGARFVQARRTFRDSGIAIVPDDAAEIDRFIEKMKQQAA